MIAIPALFWLSNGEPAKAAKTTQQKRTSSAKRPVEDWDFASSVVVLPFDRPQGKIRNIFRPLVSIDKTVLKTDPEEQMKVPANFAAGESDWTYTGMVEIDGVKMALLENPSSHQGGYVKEGDSWKKSRILHITSASIVVAGMDGGEETVFRFNANQTPKPKPPPDPGFRPMNVDSALRGVIGSKLEISPTDTETRTAPKISRGDQK